MENKQYICLEFWGKGYEIAAGFINKKLLNKFRKHADKYPDNCFMGDTIFEKDFTEYNDICWYHNPQFEYVEIKLFETSIDITGEIIPKDQEFDKIKPGIIDWKNVLNIKYNNELEEKIKPDLIYLSSFSGEKGYWGCSNIELDEGEVFEKDRLIFNLTNLEDLFFPGCLLNLIEYKRRKYEISGDLNLKQIEFHQYILTNLYNKIIPIFDGFEWNWNILEDIPSSIF